MQIIPGRGTAAAVVAAALVMIGAAWRRTGSPSPIRAGPMPPAPV